MIDEHDRLVHAIEWGRTPPPAPPEFLHDRATAVELVWAVFMLRRPSAIDDERLQALVEHPPVPHARILSELLSLRFFEWLRRSLAAMMLAYIDDPPEQGMGALEPLLATSRTRYSDKHEGMRETWDSVLDCRQLDACLGLLLARAAMLDPDMRPSLVQGYADPMATRAAGCFASWCRGTLNAWDVPDRALRASAAAGGLPEIRRQAGARGPSGRLHFVSARTPERRVPPRRQGTPGQMKPP